MRTGLYAGTFDPLTLGHLDIIGRASLLVDRLVIGVAINRDKGPMFNLEERVAMVEAEIAKLNDSDGQRGEIIVHPFENLLIDCANDVGATVIIRGLRAVADFEYEYQMVGMNRALDDSIETMFLMAEAKYQAIASKLVKEIARLEGDVSKFVTPDVRSALLNKLGIQGVRWIRRASRTLIVLYIVYAVAMIFLHPRFIYPFQDRPFELAGFTAHQIESEKGIGPTAYVHDAGAGAAAVLYFMGNAGSLSYFTSILEHHRTNGHSVIAMAYRGGGGVPGEPSETVLKRDALALFDALPKLLQSPPQKVVAHGYSLGTGLALHVGKRREIAHVILSAPYTKMCRLMAQASGLPACLLPGVQKWNSVADADLATPVLVLHGSEDALIPIAEGRDLATEINESGTATATLIEVRGAGHTDLMRFPDYLKAIDSVFSN